MSYSLIAHTGVQGASSPTTSGINTTGANLIVVNVTQAAAGTLSDSNGNTWTGLTQQGGGVVRTQLFYCFNPTVGAGHTFTYSGTNIFSTITVQAWSGSTSSPFDQQNGSSGSTGASRSPGSVTPGQNNELIVTAIAPDDGSTGVPTVDSGFTVTDAFAFSSGLAEGGAMAYLVQTSAAAVNPTWSWTTSAGTSSAVIATFKASIAGGVIFSRGMSPAERAGSRPMMEVE